MPTHRQPKSVTGHQEERDSGAEMGNTAENQADGSRRSNTCFTSNASAVHASLNRLTVTTSSGSLAFRHARIALTASDRSDHERDTAAIDSPGHNDNTIDPADRQMTVTTSNAHAHWTLTAAFSANCNHGVKSVVVWVEIAFLFTSNVASVSHAMHSEPERGVRHRHNPHLEDLEGCDCLRQGVAVGTSPQ